MQVLRREYDDLHGPPDDDRAHEEHGSPAAPHAYGLNEIRVTVQLAPEDLQPWRPAVVESHNDPACGQQAEQDVSPDDVFHAGIITASSSVGRALRLGRRGPRFETWVADAGYGRVA